MLKRTLKIKAFSLIEVAVTILIIGILIAGVFVAEGMIKKSRIATAQAMTASSPIGSIRDTSLWLESSMDSSFSDSEAVDGHAVTNWKDSKVLADKASISVNGSGAKYANTINYIHAVEFDGTSANYLQIDDASFLNKTDYTIIVLEKRKSNSSDNYFLGDSPSGAANTKLALGYSLNGKVIHAQGSNSYTSNVSAYEDSVEKPRIFTFISDSSGKKNLHQRSVGGAKLRYLTTFWHHQSCDWQILPWRNWRNCHLY